MATASSQLAVAGEACQFQLDPAIRDLSAPMDFRQHQHQLDAGQFQAAGNSRARAHRQRPRVYAKFMDPSRSTWHESTGTVTPNKQPSWRRRLPRRGSAASPGAVCIRYVRRKKKLTSPQPSNCFGKHHDGGTDKRHGRRDHPAKQASLFCCFEADLISRVSVSSAW